MESYVSSVIKTLLLTALRVVEENMAEGCTYLFVSIHQKYFISSFEIRFTK